MPDTERKPHKYCAIIKAWADGAIVQARAHADLPWHEITWPSFDDSVQWRVKPEPVHLYGYVSVHKTISGMEYVRCNDASATQSNLDNIRFTVTDGEVTALELIK